MKRDVKDRSGLRKTVPVEMYLSLRMTDKFVYLTDVGDLYAELRDEEINETF